MIDLFIVAAGFVSGYVTRMGYAYLRRLRAPLAWFEIPSDMMDGKETP
jgi:hypothetical protein